MDADNHPPNNPEKPPAHVYSDKEFDARFNQLFVARKPSNNFFADELGAVSSIELPGAWTVRSRNKRVGMFHATAFIQNHKVVSHGWGYVNPQIVALLKEAPHSLAQAKIDSLKGIDEDKTEIVAASTIDLKGKTALQVYSQKPSGESRISLYFAAGTLYPENVEILSFESAGNIATLQKDIDLAKQTLVWNGDRWRPKTR